MSKAAVTLSSWVLVYERFRSEIMEIAIKHGVEVHAIFSRKRDIPTVLARDAVVSLLIGAGLSASSGGGFLSRDHSTLIHALKKKRVSESNLTETIENLVFAPGDSQKAAREARKEGDNCDGNASAISAVPCIASEESA